MAETIAPRRPVPTGVRQFGILLRIGIRGAAQYRLDLLLTMIGAILYQGISLAFVGVVVHAFGSLAGWSFAEIGFLYGIRSLSHALCTVPLGQLWQVDMVVRQGEFDRYLLRPVNTYVQLIARRFPVAALGDLALGVGILAITTAAVPVDWTPASVAYLLAAAVGGGMVEAALLTGIAALSFRLMSTFETMGLIDSILATFGPYPLSLLPKGVSYALTFVVPLAFVAYFPAAILLGRTGALIVPVWLAEAAPAAGAVLFAISLWFFHRQSRHYSSPGH